MTAPVGTPTREDGGRYCDQCGAPDSAAGHDRCAARRELEPPREEHRCCAGPHATASPAAVLQSTHGFAWQVAASMADLDGSEIVDCVL